MLISKRLLDGQFAEDDAGVAKLRHLGVLEASHTVSWGTGVSSGAVAIEAADREDYDGEWALLDTVTFVGTAPKQDVKQITGAYGAVRHRISTVVTDGTVTTQIVGG